MKRFIEGENRFQSTLFPESLEDYIAEDNAIRAVDAFVNKLDLKQLGFDRAERRVPLGDTIAGQSKNAQAGADILILQAQTQIAQTK